jgi:hypothetical protein
MNGLKQGSKEHSILYYPFYTKMSTISSNLGLSNGVYSVLSNGIGTLTISQATTRHYTLQYSPFITNNYIHNHNISIKDANSNITASLQNSNLLITNKTSNLFNVSVAPYLQSNTFNTLSLNRQENYLQVNLNSTAIVRISNSNEIPKAYDNSSIEVSTSNGSFSNVVYNPIATVDSPMSFTKPTKFLSISVSNISSPALDTMSNVISSTSNTTYWSSNQCFLNTSNYNNLTNNFVSFSNSITTKSISTSNSLVSLSNVIVPQATFGSNVSVHSSNAVVGLSNLIIPRASYASNNTTSLSNAFYTSTTSSTATYASNTATWSSNNNINRTNDTISTLNTDGILMPSSANIIGSGWYYNSGWVVQGANGGYVIRNSGGGGMEIYTGTSNNFDICTVFSSNKNVGIGTYTPTEKLHVVGTAQFQGTTSPGSGIYSKCKWLNPAGGYGGLLVSHDTTYGNQSVIDNSVNPLDVVVEGTTRLCVQKATGRTGINTNNPQYTLHVAGTFFASNVNSPTIDNLSNAAYPAFNRSFWNSNNLFNKAGGTITGDVSILRGAGVPTTLSINSTGVGNTQSIIQFVNNGHTIVCADSNWNNQTRPTGGHCVFYTSGGHIFSGDAIFNGNLGGNAITNLSNMAIWSSNTARYSSNYGGTLCNLATDAFNKAVYGSNVANWSSNALLNPSFSNLTATGYAFFKPGSAASGGFTHLPFSGDGRNYLRGSVVACDNGGNFGIGTATPAYKLDVNGTAKINVLQVGTNGDPMAEMSHYSVTIPSSGVKTFQLDVSGTFPSSAVVYGTVQSGNPAYDDCFGVTVMATSASNIKFSISRIDGNSWGSSHTLNFMVVGF